MRTAKNASEISGAFDRQCARDVDEYYAPGPEWPEGENIIMSDGTEGKILSIFGEWDEGYHVPMIELETSPEMFVFGLGWETWHEAVIVTALYHDIWKGA